MQDATKVANVIASYRGCSLVSAMPDVQGNKRHVNPETKIRKRLERYATGGQIAMPLTTTITWIPTSERLPEIGDSTYSEVCLVIGTDGRVTQASLYKTHKTQVVKWLEWRGDYKRPLSNFTHWAPMPTVEVAPAIEWTPTSDVDKLPPLNERVRVRFNGGNETSFGHRCVVSSSGSPEWDVESSSSPWNIITHWAHTSIAEVAP